MKSISYRFVAPVKSQPVPVIEHGVESFIIRKRMMVKRKLFCNGLAVNAHMIVSAT